MTAMRSRPFSTRTRGASFLVGRSTDAVPHGIYVVRDTLHIPVGTRLVGEAQPVILGAGERFQDEHHPQAVVRVGHQGDKGELVICDMLFSTRGPAGGAVVMEWNVHESYQGSVAMFDSHIRIGGAYVLSLTQARNGFGAWDVWKKPHFGRTSSCKFPQPAHYTLCQRLFPKRVDLDRRPVRLYTYPVNWTKVRRSRSTS